MALAYAIALALALAEARSCLAALAENATDFDESVHYEHLLLDLDGMHEKDGYPALYPIASDDRIELLRKLEAAVDKMLLLDFVVDGLQLELLFAGATLPGGTAMAAWYPWATKSSVFSD